MGRVIYFFYKTLKYVTPVSYTHLDVYKRQGADGADKTNNHCL